MSTQIQAVQKARYISSEPQRSSVGLAKPRYLVFRQKNNRILLLLFFMSLPLVNPWVRGDGVGYYAYIRSLLVEHKLDFANDWKAGNQSFTMGRVHADGKIDPLQYTRTGHLDNHFSVGPSILWAPFLLPVHLTMSTLHTLGLNVRPDGFSRPYVIATALATALYGFLGLYLSFRLACLYIEERWALLATVGIWFASSLPVYMYFNPSWSHAHSAFVVAVFLWYWHHTRQARTLRQWIILGLISGLMLDVYYANVALLLLPLLEFLRAYWGIRRVTDRRWQALRRLLAANLLYSFAALLAFLPTLISRRIIYGGPLEMGYAGEQLWTSPAFTKILFSADHGLLTWTPIIIPALAGLVLLHRIDLQLSIYLSTITAAFCYLLACHADWDGLSSFGNRFFISLTPLFILGLAVAFSEFSKCLTRSRQAFASVCVVTCLLILWNLGFMFQWGTHLIPVRGPISWRQMAYNQVNVVPAAFGKQLYAYFVNRRGMMQQIEDKDIRQLKRPTKAGEQND